MIQPTILGLLFGTIGTTIGGILGICLKKKSNKFISFALSFASGTMLAVICFSLIPKSLSVTSSSIALLGIVFGIIMMLICEKIINNIFDNIIKKSENRNNIANRKRENLSLLKTGIAVSIGLALHNIPEGLAIGSGFEASKTLGFSLAMAICMHDIPEGLSMAIPMKNGGMKSFKIMIYVAVSGIATGLGAFIGALFGNISITTIAICLSFAAGAMLYIVSGELIPEYSKLYNGKLSSIGNIIGFIIGLVAIIVI